VAAVAAASLILVYSVSGSDNMDENIAFEEIIKKTDKLPTLPGIALKIMDAMRQEEPNLDEITKLIASDPSLSVEVLKCINSPFYSLQAKITSVNHAVSMMGFNTVKYLALSFSLVKNFKPEGPFSFDYNSFWKDSLIGAASARALAADVLPEFSEDAFFLGLLHNLGILTLVRCLPKQYSLVIKEMQTSGCSYHEAEDLMLGFNHMAIGRHLIESWGLPELLYLPIGFHHQPEKLSTEPHEIKILTQILHLSSLFIDLFNDADKCFTLGLIELHAKSYQFEDKITIDDIGKKIHDHTQQIFPLFEISVKDQDHYSQLIDSARDELMNLANGLMDKVVRQKREIQSLKEQITRDVMTPLINYQYFHELLDQEIYRSRRYKYSLSIIFLDIDDLKSINDTFGIPAGDHVIKSMAECLKKELRQSDHIARYGGDEFGIILPETPLEGGLQIAERLKEAISSLNTKYENKKLSASLSLGVASLLAEQEVSKNEFIKMAEKALSLAKANGKNQCFAVKA
jgi:diguanylate cyclase (GGDEF)-like protein